MSIRFDNDPRIVMTLDAGGTYLKFSAIRGNQLLVGPISVPGVTPTRIESAKLGATSFSECTTWMRRVPSP